MSFDIEDVRVPGLSSETAPNPTPPRHKPGQKFVSGPIPLAWLEIAGRLPGKALHVAVHAWFLAGVQKSRRVRASGALLARMGVRRFSAYRALVALESVGLVTVERHRGRAPAITLKELPEGEATNGGG